MCVCVCVCVSAFGGLGGLILLLITDTLWQKFVTRIMPTRPLSLCCFSHHSFGEFCAASVNALCHDVRPNYRYRNGGDSTLRSKACNTQIDISAQWYRGCCRSLKASM